jgi:hypothetical protein
MSREPPVRALMETTFSKGFDGITVESQPETPRVERLIGVVDLDISVRECLERRAGHHVDRARVDSPGQHLPLHKLPNVLI